jgi:LacI family transcriptional regulator
MMLLHNNSRIIGVIMFTEPRHNETVLEDPFSSAILGAMERDIRVAGYYMMLYVSSDEDEVVRLSKSWKMDGFPARFAASSTPASIFPWSTSTVFSMMMIMSTITLAWRIRREGMR